jgi:hypothetical protein
MWFKYAKQKELFPEFKKPSGIPRERELEILPPEHSDLKVGPFYHGSPYGKDILDERSLGLGIGKIPTFGGINAPLHDGLYFTSDEDIADTYTRGSVSGMKTNDIISNIDIYLDSIRDWDYERIRAADEDEYDDFERSVEYATDSSFYDSYDLSSDAIAQIIWNYIRKGPEREATIQFRKELKDVFPDEDFVYTIIHDGANSVIYDGGYMKSIFTKEGAQRYIKAAIKYIIIDLIESISRSHGEALVKKAIKKSKDDFEKIDNLINILRKDYYDEDGELYIDDTDFMIMVDEFDEETAIDFDIAYNKFLDLLKEDTCHMLGIVSLISVGKAATSPIPRDQFKEYDVKGTKRDVV